MIYLFNLLKRNDKTRILLFLLLSTFTIFYISPVIVEGISELINTYAGNFSAGMEDAALLEANFNAPYGMFFDKDGNLIVMDSNNSIIREIADGKVITIAGKPEGFDEYKLPMGGYLDGPALKAKLNRARFSAVDSNGIIYIADTLNNTIRKMSNGEIRTLSGNGKVGYVDGFGDTSEFNSPMGVAIDSKDNIYIADTMNNVIRKITPQGLVSTYAGKQSENGGYRDGEADKAMFNEPSDLVFGQNDVLYVLDTGNQLLRKIENGKVTTVCGTYVKPTAVNPYVAGGYQDGYSVDVMFNFPKGLCITEDGTIFVADSWNNVIRAVLPNKKVVTVAGTGVAGNVSGDPLESQFSAPVDVAYRDGKLYVSDMINNCIKVMEISTSSIANLPIKGAPDSGIYFAQKTSSLQVAIKGKIFKITESNYNYTESTGVTYVSVEKLVKAWGAKFTWDKVKKKITITKNKTKYTYYTNKAPIKIYNKIPMMEIRALAKKLGMKTYALPDKNAFVLY